MSMAKKAAAASPAWELVLSRYIFMSHSFFTTLTAYIGITILDKIETSRAPKDAFGRVVPRKDRNLCARSQKTTL